MANPNRPSKDALYARVLEAGQELRVEKLKELREYLLLTSRAGWVENPDNLTPDDKHAIAECERALPLRVDRLERVIGQVQDDTVKNALVFAIVDLATAFRVAAKYAPPSDLAKRQLRSAQRSGGKSRGEQKSKQAKDSWQGAALEVARALRLRKPECTQYEIWEAITNSWDKEGREYPVGDRAIFQIIPKWEASGQLPKKSIRKP